MKKALFIVVVLGAIGYGGWYYLNSQKPALPPGVPQPDTFVECAKYFAVADGYPRKCTNGAGVVLTEDIGNGPELQDSIRVTLPVPSDIISSPVSIKGEALAEWFSDDNSVDITVVDANGKSVGSGKLDSKNLVSYGRSYPFEGLIPFTRPSYSATGAILIQKNGSSTFLRIPIVFR